MQTHQLRTVWMFSGQGSQYYQMGRELYERHPLFREELERADRIAGRMINASLLEIIYQARDDRFEPFDQVLYTHPALLMIECALARVLLESSIRPDALLGYSLGELSAMVVADVISLEDAMTFAVKAAEVITYCAPAGKMVAVLHSADLVERHPEAFAGCEVAAQNFPGNFIVTGLAEPITRLQRFLAGRDISMIELPVTYPFHSSSMSAIEAPLRAVAAQLSFATPRIPVLSATSGEPVTSFSSLRLLQAMGSQVDFQATVKKLERSAPCRYIDLGPSGSMATTVKYNLGDHPDSEALAVITRFGHDLQSLQRVLERLTLH